MCVRKLEEEPTCVVLEEMQDTQQKMNFTTKFLGPPSRQMSQICQMMSIVDLQGQK